MLCSEVKCSIIRERTVKYSATRHKIMHHTSHHIAAYRKNSKPDISTTHSIQFNSIAPLSTFNGLWTLDSTFNSLSSTCSHNNTLLCTYVRSIQNIQQRRVTRTYIQLTQHTHTHMFSHTHSTKRKKTNHNSAQSILQFV